MKTHDEFSDYYADLLDGRYDCVDRIVLNGYFALGQQGGGFRYWWRQLTGSDATLDQEHVREMAGRFSRRVHAYAKRRRIPLRHCAPGVRKHELAERYRPTDPAFTGLFLILVAKAPALVWEVTQSAGGVPHLTRKTPWPYVNHYHFPILDKDWGHLTFKLSGHPPFGVQVSLNGHEWVERRPRTGADPDPVLRHPLQGHQALRHQRGHALGEEGVQEGAVRRAEVRQGVVVHGDAPAEPLVCEVRGAPPVQRPRGAHGLQRGVQPEGQEDLGIGGRAAGLAFDRLDLLVERGQAQVLHVRPHDPGPVVLGEQALQVNRPQADLGPVGLAEPGGRGGGRGARRARGIWATSGKSVIGGPPQRACRVSHRTRVRSG